MEETDFLETITHDLSNALIEEEKPKINARKVNQTKNFESLESNLINTLVDPFDSDIRKRYIKRWIYGEIINGKKKKINQLISSEIFLARLMK